MIQHLLNDSLVIADLADHNPNVFYELALRHVVRKPIVQLIKSGQTIPFDISPMRTLKYDLTDPDDVVDCVEKLSKQITVALSNPSEADNPISASVDLQALKTSSNPNERSEARIMEAIQALSVEIAEVKKGQSFWVVPPKFAQLGLKSIRLGAEPKTSALPEVDTDILFGSYTKHDHKED